MASARNNSEWSFIPLQSNNLDARAMFALPRLLDLFLLALKKNNI